MAEYQMENQERTPEDHNVDYTSSPLHRVMDDVIWANKSSNHSEEDKQEVRWELLIELATLKLPLVSLGVQDLKEHLNILVYLEDHEEDCVCLPSVVSVNNWLA